MKTLICTSVAAGTLCFTLCGCLSQSVQLQSLDVSGPRSEPPVHLELDSASSGITVSPHLNIRTGPALEGTFLDEGSIPVPNNVRWRASEFAAGIDADLAVSRLFAFSVGGTVANNLWGGNAGVGLRIRGKSISGRLETGVLWQAVNSHAVYKLANDFLFNSTTDTTLEERNVRQSHVNWYAALTLNTMIADGPVNGFLQVGLVRQTLFSVELLNPSVNDATYVSSGVVVTPGVAIALDEQLRLLVGAHINFESGMESPHPDPTFLPFLQVDIRL